MSTGDQLSLPASAVLNSQITWRNAKIQNIENQGTMKRSYEKTKFDGFCDMMFWDDVLRCHNVMWTP